MGIGMGSSGEFDALIIGGGVIGSSIAYHVARQGGRALVVERGEVAQSPAASWASAGGVRRQGRHPAEAALASEAIARWPSLEDELDAELHYRQGGNLVTAESEAEAAGLVEFVREQQAMGFADVRVVDGDELRKLAPALSERVVAASFSPADGQADPPRTTRAFATAAIRNGATYWTKTECGALLVERGRVVGARTSSGEVHARAVALAAGAWSDEIAATAGLRLPIRTRALQMLLSTPAPRGRLRPVLGSVSRPLSLKQLGDGAFVIGGGWLGDISSDRRSYTLRNSSQRGSWATATELVPEVGGQHIAQAWCGLEAESFDDIPFIGPAPALDGLVLALGFSGHGFALAPAVGRAVADLLAGQAVPALDGLSPARMATFDPAAVAAFEAEGPEDDEGLQPG
jgi:sarcosine oxidase subunit beta